MKTIKKMKTMKTMKTIKEYGYIFLASVIMISLTSCGNDSDPAPIPTPVVNTTYQGDITEDVTWTSNNIYTLDGRVMVIDGVTLTIESGTIIKGAAGTGADASCLVIARGGKIMANGTEIDPIVFTSIADDITNGKSGFGTGLSSADQGLWGGILILGKADISADANPKQIEGIPVEETNGLYGGGNTNNNNDNSGVFHYVQIRHGGAEIGEGNEINGLTLGGVGSGTSIHHVEIIANLDDGLECFGGSVNISNVLVWGQGDDAFDIDQSYSGNIDNFLGILVDGDQGLEIDGWEGTMQADFTLTNGTIIGADGEKNNCGTFKSNASGSVTNMLFTNMKLGATLTVDAGVTGITFSNMSFDSGTDFSTTLIDGLGGIDFDANTSSNGGANLDNFNNWTCASTMGAY